MKCFLSHRFIFLKNGLGKCVPCQLKYGFLCISLSVHLDVMESACAEVIEVVGNATLEVVDIAGRTTMYFVSLAIIKLSRTDFRCTDSLHVINNFPFHCRGNRRYISHAHLIGLFLFLGKCVFIWVLFMIFAAKIRSLKMCIQLVKTISCTPKLEITKNAASHAMNHNRKLFSANCIFQQLRIREGHC